MCVYRGVCVSECVCVCTEVFTYMYEVKGFKLI